MPMMLDRVLVRGPFHGPSGYDHHTRELVRAFVGQGAAVQLVDFPEWGPARLPPEHLDRWFDSLGQGVGARWWEPDEDAAVAAIRAAVERRDSTRRSARERVLRDLTWTQAARRLLALLAEAERERFGGRRRLALPWRRA